MKLVTLISILSMTASTAWASGHVLAKEAPSLLHPRATFQGGWPIEATTCPGNTTSCDITGACCPGSTNCYTEGLSGDAVCCPTTANCYDTAKALPICADPSWTLYMGNYNFFCCPKGQLGILPNSADTVKSGLCVDGGSNVASSALASAYTTSPSTGTRSASIATATATTTTKQGIISAVASDLTKGSATSSAGGQTTATGAKSNDSARRSLSMMTIVGLVVVVGFGLVVSL